MRREGGERSAGWLATASSEVSSQSFIAVDGRSYCCAESAIPHSMCFCSETVPRPKIYISSFPPISVCAHCAVPFDVGFSALSETLVPQGSQMPGL